jgi:hypothetical protein
MMSPPQGAPAAIAPLLTLDQFASLSAEVAHDPSQLEAIRRRYGFDEAAHEGEKHRWAMRFLGDPPLGKSYQEKVAAFSAWLRQRR